MTFGFLQKTILYNVESLPTGSRSAGNGHSTPGPFQFTINDPSAGIVTLVAFVLPSPILVVFGGAAGMALRYSKRSDSSSSSVTAASSKPANGEQKYEEDNPNMIMYRKSGSNFVASVPSAGFPRESIEHTVSETDWCHCVAARRILPD
ncbi:hypothetical protein LSH36_31g09043 [Paralvinella palmiformis]|uniref:Uncharacterized protein n=1 Tax=Paralvinella palmiformis TaxID=53620 RepID=A0AAD9K9U3_9ANNE|nr:hypothetical protein LSH36_31g09043 [Paralvinella palmiformis]